MFLLNILGIGDKYADPEEMSFPVIKILVLFSTALGVTLLASNLAALKMWNLCGIPVDAGIFLFPISYVVGDLLVNIYGQKLANLVAVFCSLFAVIVAILMLFAKVILPDFPGVDNEAFNIVQGATGRIFLASVAGFLVSQITNNSIFARIRAAQQNVELLRGGDNDSGFKWRAFISSVVARFPDSLLFETLAFIGRVSMIDFIKQATFAYVAGIIVELALLRFTAALASRLRCELQYENGENKCD